MRLFLVAGVALAMFASPVAFAQSLPSTPHYAPARGPDTYGTASETIYTISSFAFEAYRQGMTVDVEPGFTGKFVTAGPAGAALVAPVFLPSGASVTGVEIQGCNSSDANMNVVLSQVFEPGGLVYNLSPSGTLGPGAGCAVSRANTSFTIDNKNNTYLILWFPTVLNDTQRLEAARIYYKLQVSPAPATPTFTDVPTSHVFFRFIEALAAWGITGGCGGGAFCPDSPVTRGQMAVFLATALGLHFPN